MRAPRATCASWPTGWGTAACSAFGGGGYDRGNLAQAWTGVVEALLAGRSIGSTIPLPFPAGFNAHVPRHA